MGSFVVFRAFANLKIIYTYVTYFQPCLQLGGPRAKSGYPYFISKFINRENVGEFMRAIDEGENTEWNIEWDQRQEGTWKPYVNTNDYMPYCTTPVYLQVFVSFNSFRHCLHGPGFICNRITFDAVKPFVYTAPIETGTKTGSFWKRSQKWSVFKTIRFHWPCKRRNRFDLKTVAYFGAKFGWLARAPK